MDPVDQVRTNLIHYNLWTDVAIHNLGQLGTTRLLAGTPPNRLAEHDEDSQLEWVVATSMEKESVSMATIESWFDAVARVAPRPKRITMAAVNDDGTVVFYFVHDGVIKPRQN